MRNLFLITCVQLVFTITSCSEKPDVIEIYLTKNKIETYEGIPLTDELKSKLKEQGHSENYINEVRMNITKNKLVYTGHFLVKKEDLEEKPFIKNSEIIGLDFENSEIHFSKSVAQKILNSLPKWQKNNYFGKQFVLCHNKKVVLSGYFLNNMTSYWSNTYQIFYYQLPKSQENDTIKTVKYLMVDSLKFKKNTLIKNKELFETFKNRVIK